MLLVDLTDNHMRNRPKEAFSFTVFLSDFFCQDDVERIDAIP